MLTKSVLIIQNVVREGAGLLEVLLREKNIPYDIVNLEQGKRSFRIEDYAVLVVLGGPESANDTTSKMQEEIQVIQDALKRQMPYLGICLGMQTLVKSAGGKVFKNPVKEVGFRDPENQLFYVALTSAGIQDPIFHELDKNLFVFQLHGETVELLPNMQLLATGKFCKNQVVKIGKNAYGFQCHFELTEEMFQCWIVQDPDLAQANQGQLQQDFNSLKKQYTEIGLKLFRNFLNIAGL